MSSGDKQDNTDVGIKWVDVTKSSHNKTPTEAQRRRTQEALAVQTPGAPRAPLQEKSVRQEIIKTEAAMAEYEKKYGKHGLNAINKIHSDVVEKSKLFQTHYVEAIESLRPPSGLDHDLRAQWETQTIAALYRIVGILNSVSDKVFGEKFHISEKANKIPEEIAAYEKEMKDEVGKSEPPKKPNVLKDRLSGNRRKN